MMNRGPNMELEDVAISIKDRCLLRYQKLEIGWLPASLVRRAGLELWDRRLSQRVSKRAAGRQAIDEAYLLICTIYGKPMVVPISDIRPGCVTGRLCLWPLGSGDRSQTPREG